MKKVFMSDRLHDEIIELETSIKKCQIGGIDCGICKANIKLIKAIKEWLNV